MMMTNRPLVLAALLCASATLSFATNWKGEGTRTSPYIIETGADLVRLSQNVSAGTDYEGTHFRLEKEVDLSSFCGGSLGNWNPIGSLGTYFEGVFDGNGHTISHLHIEGGGNSHGGLFGYVGSHGRIENLTVEGTVYSSFWAGLVAGGNGGTITHCTSRGETEAWQIAGGVVGGNFGILSNCRNLATVKSTLATGGVAGYNYGSLRNSQNRGEVYGHNAAGGLVGYNGGFASFNNCHNVPMGIVQNCANTAFVSGQQKVGGIAGRNDGLMANCSNLGELSAEREVGGLAGLNGGFDGVDGFVYNSYNHGDINCAIEMAGGIVGVNNSVGDVANVYNSGQIRTPNAGGALLATNSGNLTHSYSVGVMSDLTGEDNGFSSDCHTFANGETEQLTTKLNQWVDDGGDNTFAHWKVLDDTSLPVFSDKPSTIHNLLVYSFHGMGSEDLLAFAEGEEVVLNVEPDPGYTLTCAVALGNDTLEVSLEGNQIRFVMPGGDVSLQLLWENEIFTDNGQPVIKPQLMVVGGKGELSITTIINTEVEIYGADGRMVRRFDTYANETRSIKLPPGMYIANGIEVVVW